MSCGLWWGVIGGGTSPTSMVGACRGVSCQQLSGLQPLSLRGQAARGHVRELHVRTAMATVAGNGNSCSIPPEGSDG